jgi:hypothetical protein
MQKTEILAALTASGEVNTFRRTPMWEKAFELHNKTTGKHKNANCGTCFRDVLAWLRN